MLDKDDPAGAFCSSIRLSEQIPTERARRGIASASGSRGGKCRGSKSSCTSRSLAARSWRRAADSLPPNGPSGVRIWRLDRGKRAAEQGSHHRSQSILGFLSSRPAKSCLSQPPAQQMRLSKPLEPSGKGRSRGVERRNRQTRRHPALSGRGNGEKGLVQPGWQRPGRWSAIWTMARKAEWRSGISRQEPWRQNRS